MCSVYMEIDDQFVSPEKLRQTAGCVQHCQGQTRHWQRHGEAVENSEGCAMTEPKVKLI